MIPQLGPIPSGAAAPQPSSDPAGPRPGSSTSAQPTTNRETARAIEPPKPADESETPTLAERRNLNPPNPDAPTGPPPAFEASLLDRKREEAFAPPDLRTEIPTPVAPLEGNVSVSTEGIQSGALDKDQPVIAPGSSADVETEASEPDRASLYDVPPTAEQRAEADVATIRQIDAPVSDATLDLSR